MKQNQMEYQNQSGLIKRAIRTGLTFFLIYRIFTLTVATMAYLVTPPHIEAHSRFNIVYYEETMIAPPPLRTLIAPWYRWDTDWYIRIAYLGYNANPLHYAFPSLYPTLIRIFAAVIGDYLLTALILSSLGFLAFLILLYIVVSEEYSERIARRTLIVLLLFPTSYYLVAGYADSLFLALALAAWLAARRQRFILTGLLALLASFARSQGAILVLPLAYLFFIEQRANWRNPGTLISRLLPLAGPPLASAMYVMTPALLGFSNLLYAGWGTSFTFPGYALLRFHQAIFSGNMALQDVNNSPALMAVVEGINGLSLMALIVAAIFGIRRLKPAMSLYFLGTLLILLMMNNEKMHLQGMFRYVIHNFPFFILLQFSLWKYTLLRQLYIIGGLAGLVICITMYVNWILIG